MRTERGRFERTGRVDLLGMNERLDQLRQQLREDPSSRLFFQLGELLRKEGELDEAEFVLRSGLEVHPRYVAAWVSLGRVEFATTRWAAAEKSYARALELDPENAVAARLIGETAEELRQYERALKAYQLAHMLSGRDPELDQKITLIERRIAGDRSYDAPTVPDLEASALFGAAHGWPEEGDSVEETEQIEEFGEINEDEDVFGEEPALPPRRRQRPSEVFSLSDDDPFAVRPTGDTGVWVAGDDVFSTPVAPEPEPVDDTDMVFPDVEGVEPVEPAAELEPEIWTGVDGGLEEVEEVEEVTLPGTPDTEAELEPETDFPQETDYDSGSELIAEDEFSEISQPSDLPDARIEDEVQAEAAFAAEESGAAAEEPQHEADDVPLPTLTLARLAVDQDDVELARRTLRSLLAQRPGDPEALQMLEELEEWPAASAPPAIREVLLPPEPALRKAAALRGWMDAIRMASERRSP